ncbi:hypothetical protein ACFWM1_16495 [Nocardia sp. NPDC058379]|uniref:hypothetical protein n=1 Tax=unclassified Nocardia TaxID=2637762 RepID=UPI003662FAE3
MELSLTQFRTIDGVSQAPGGPDEDTVDGFTRGGWSAPFDDEDFDVFIASYRADGAPKYGDFSAG